MFEPVLPLHGEHLLIKDLEGQFHGFDVLLFLVLFESCEDSDKVFFQEATYVTCLFNESILPWPSNTAKREFL